MTDLLLHTTPPTGLSVSTLIAVDPGSAGWEFCSLTVLRLTPGTSWRGKTGPDEVALVPLSGSCTVRSGEHRVGHRRPGECLRRTDLLGLPADQHRIPGTGRGRRSSWPSAGRAPSDRIRPASSRPTRSRSRSAGPGMPPGRSTTSSSPTSRPTGLLVVEVITPSGNWSSYPPHKHDVSRMPAEADLEEIYYYRIDPPDGFALQRLYTADGRIDEA